MIVNINLALDTRYKKKDNTFPIILRLGSGERTLPIPTGVSVKEKDWDDKKKEVKKSYDVVSSVTKLNNYIDSQKKRAKDIVLELEQSGLLSKMTLKDVKSHIVLSQEGHSFFSFTEQKMKELTLAKRIGTKNAYKDAARAIEIFHGSRKLNFEQITYQFLTKFETKHYQSGFTANGLAAYLRSIRAIYNKAIKSGVVDEKHYPFKKYTIKTQPTEKRALDWGPLKKIISLELKPENTLFHARNYFVASYMMYGMNFTDMAYLTKQNIVEGRIQYRRSKTSKLYDIKITPALQQILEYYIEHNTDEDFIFPIIKRQSAEDQNKDIMWARKRYNKKLKLLAAMCGIEKKLTSYVSRHSFATQAMMQEIPINAISAMLGHSSLKTTQIYLKSLPNNILDSYNERLLSIK